MADAKKITMDELLASASDSIKKVAAGDTVSGVVLSVKKHEILRSDRKFLLQLSIQKWKMELYFFHFVKR